MDCFNKIKEFFTPRKHKWNDNTTTDALGHNHEWDEMWHKDENGNHVRKEGWVFCWICDRQEPWENIKKI